MHKYIPHFFKGSRAKNFLKTTEQRYASTFRRLALSRLRQGLTTHKHKWTFLTRRRVAGPLVGCLTSNTLAKPSAARESKKILMRSLAELIRCICLISPAPHMFCVGFVRRHFVIVCGLHYPPLGSSHVRHAVPDGAGLCLIICLQVSACFQFVSVHASLHFMSVPFESILFHPV
jgi:hypothetical protein